jgi:hypothetical protein
MSPHYRTLFLPPLHPTVEASAKRLGLRVSNGRVEFHAPLPADVQRLLDQDSKWGSGHYEVWDGVVHVPGWPTD